MAIPADLSVLEKQLDELCFRLPKTTASYQARSDGETLTWYVGKSLLRAFCHLHRADKVVAFRRNRSLGYLPYEGYTTLPHNFVGMPLAQVKDEGFVHLLAESNRLANMRAQGVNAHVGFESAHPILRAALDEVPEENRAPPWHGGGAPPKLPSGDTRRIALWSAKILRPLAPDDECQEFDAIAETIDRYLRTADHQFLKDLNKPSGQRKGSLALQALQRAAGAVVSKPDLSWMGACATSGRSARALVLAATRAPMSPSAFLLELDHKIACGELQGELDKRKSLQASAPLARVLWRGTDDRDYTNRWLARLDGGSYGFLGKIGRRFQWFEGSLEDATAHVTDESFAEAVRVAVSRDLH
tara:strand:- start:18405 stop:19478 length:1074 start_codon:yes stop_codon:yes gene_type:complete